MAGNVISAVFDDRAEAQRAINQLRDAGVDDAAISIVGRPDEAGDGDNDRGDDVSKTSIAASTAAGGVTGALLGVAALAIPGVGPLAAAGAIATWAVPPVAAFGAAFGATGGAIARMLSDHDVDRNDAEYYEEHIGRGGTFVSVDTRQANVDREQVRAILRDCGGHNASSPRTATV